MNQIQNTSAELNRALKRPPEQEESTAETWKEQIKYAINEYDPFEGMDDI